MGWVDHGGSKRATASHTLGGRQVLLLLVARTVLNAPLDLFLAKGTAATTRNDLEQSQVILGAAHIAV